jgi:uncharacterized protein with FMN-binding domain
VSGKNRKTGNLVALGSAAVVAVYGAGFMRTAEAAQRFAEQSDERRVVADDVTPGVTVPGAANDASATVVANAPANTEVNAPPSRVANAPINAPAGNAKQIVDAATAIKKVDATTAKVAQQSAAASRSGDVSVPMPPEVTTVMSASGVAVTPPQPTAPAETRAVPAEKPASTAATTPSASVATTSTPTSTSAPVQPAPVKAAPVVAAAAPAPAPTPAAPVAAAPVSTPPAATRWKDGEYTGYGTSRHGDVEVYLETTDGKITYIKISQCLTQYSCSWIEDLPKQVLARQSTKVDAVSGATQSANAFYYALVAALAKAK